MREDGCSVDRVVQSVRIPTADVAIRGCPMRRGESVVVFLAAANRDPEVYPEPDRFDVTRRDVHHQSFGGGVRFTSPASYTPGISPRRSSHPRAPWRASASRSRSSLLT